MLTSALAYQLPCGVPPLVARSRVRTPTLGFFDDLKEGFESGMSANQPRERQDAQSRAVDDAQPAASIFNGIKGLVAGLSPKELTEEERIEERKRAGEGVVWSADYSRAWRAKKGMPQDEISLEEARMIATELSIPIPGEAGPESDYGVFSQQ